MLKIADDVFLLDGIPRCAINIYIAGEILIDAGTRHAERRIFRQIAGRTITAHALTHPHPDHQGASHAVCTRLGIPLWCGAIDADAMEQGDWYKLTPANSNLKLQHKFWTGPAHPVARRLKEGDQVGDFTVLDVQGHSPGHIAFWRERDRLLILGDVLNGMNLITTMPGLHEPPNLFTVDPAQNRRSIRKLAALNPETLCFGHGPPVFHAAEKLRTFAEQLPD
jgi:glyoxylase-like metal-dependent hydrolase (beta-lactamase superfamily II)